MKVGFLGPAGTYSEEAVLAGDGAADIERVPLPSVHDAVAAVRDGHVERALVPIENSLEGSVNATLDALAHETGSVQITGELVHPIHHCLIARAAVPLEQIAAVASHPQASAQCATFIRARLAGAAVVPAASTADAVRLVADRATATALRGPRSAAGWRRRSTAAPCSHRASRTRPAPRRASCGSPASRRTRRPAARGRPR